MGKCIICQEEKSDLTKEHIIPFGVGNRMFTIENVCRECNSKLGSKLDNYVSESFIAKIFREQHSLKGHSGKVPVSLEKGHLKDGTPVTKKNGRYVGKINVIQDDKNLKVTAPSVEEAIEIVSKIMEKKGKTLSNEEYKKLIKANVHFENEIEFQFEMNMYIVCLEMLKIILESYVYFCGDKCLLDPELNSIRKVLCDYIYDDIIDEKFIDERCLLVNEEIKDLFNKLLLVVSSIGPQVDDVVHILCFVKNKDWTTVLTWIQGSLPFAFKLKISDEYSIDKMLLISKINGIIEL